MPAAPFSVGVDLGGTWIRLEAVDSQKQRLRSFKGPAPSLLQLPAVLERRLTVWKTRPSQLVVASRGVWARAERLHLQRALRHLAARVIVMSDVEAAWFAAFAAGDPGVMVIAGTGSIAYGRDKAGRFQRSGGWGPLLGDEGSAFWIGKTWLKQTYREDALHRVLALVRHSDKAVRRIAGLTPGILNRARRGHQVAQSIVKEAQCHLASLIVDTAGRLHLKTPIPVSWGGSLLNNPYFRTGVFNILRRMKRSSQPRFKIISPGNDPALAVACLFEHG